MRHVLQFLMTVTLLLPAALHGEELEMVNRPVNTSGMTGLIVTTSPFTLPPNTFEFGFMTLSENSLIPRYTATEYPVSVSLGITQRSEIALKGVFHYINVQPDHISRGMGDTELSYKLNVRPQTEFSSIPGIALILTGVLPTGDSTAGMNSVDNWGARMGLALGSELLWEDHIIGIFADGQFEVQDLSDKVLRDSYSLIHAGILFPISKYRNLQMIIEYSQTKGKDFVTVDGVNFSAVTYGLRLVNERFNLTFGTQFIHKSEEGSGDSNRMIGMVSVKL